MKRVIRLTEGDLVKLIKKVMNEDTTSNDPRKTIEECIMSNVTLKDITKYKNCMIIGTKISKGEIPTPTDVQSAMSELKANKQDSCVILPKIMSCVAKKTTNQDIPAELLDILKIMCDVGSMIPDLPIPKPGGGWPGF